MELKSLHLVDLTDTTAEKFVLEHLFQWVLYFFLIFFPVDLGSHKYVGFFFSACFGFCCVFCLLVCLFGCSLLVLLLINSSKITRTESNLEMPVGISLTLHDI